jgi:hypothetical protein
MSNGGKDIRAWRCRVCGFERFHRVAVMKKNNVRYETGFLACSGCSVMFINSETFNAIGKANPNVEAPPSVVTRYAQGATPQGIAADLNERKVPSPGATWERTVRRCGGWGRSAIWQMLRNPIYSGTYYWKRVQWIKTENGRHVKPHPCD